MSQLMKNLKEYEASLREQIRARSGSNSDNAHVARILGDELPDDVEIWEQRYDDVTEHLAITLWVEKRFFLSVSFRFISEVVTIGTLSFPLSTNPFWTDPKVVRAIYLALK